MELNNGRDNCNNRFEGSKVCVEPYTSKKDGIYSCVIKIKDFNDKLEGI